MSDSQSHLSAAARRRISLDGWWIARSAQLGGVRLPDDALPGLSMVLFNQTLYLGSDVGTIDVDHAVVPATFDVLIVRGPNKWRFLPGIAAVSGRTMRMCLDLSGAARPGAFVSPLRQPPLFRHVRADTGPRPALVRPQHDVATHEVWPARAQRFDMLTSCGRC